MKGPGLLDGGDRAVEGQVEGESPFIGFAVDADFLESFKDFESEGPDAGLHAIASELSRRPDHIDGFSVGNRDERIRGAQIGILTHSRDEEELITGRVHVEVVPVVEIPVTGEDVIERLAGLMGEEFIHGADGHQDLL